MKLLLWLLLATSLAWAAPTKSYPVRFRTFPEDVLVFRYHPESESPEQDECWGSTSKPIFVSLRESDLRHELVLYFVYLPKSQRGKPHLRPPLADMVHVRASELVGTGHYPRHGVLRVNLTAGQWLGYLWERYWWAALALLGLGAAAGRLVWRVLHEAQLARLREQQRVELTADLVRQDPLEGEILSDYLILGRLGEGGMGVVYKAVPKSDPRPENVVAVKLIRSLDAEFRARFFREVNVYQKLRHPNILTVLETGLAEVKGIPDGWPFMVMELIEGRPLRQVMKDHPDGMPLRPASVILAQIFQAVLYAHHQNVVHRDLKPENVMVADNKRVVVMDFGLARAPDLDTVTAHGDVMGSPVYMSPEQLRGSFSPLSDQYALGVVCYELLSGQLPFEAETTVQVIMQHMHHDPRPLSELRPNLPDVVQNAVMRMLAKEPEERFSGLHEILPIWESFAQAKGMRPAG